MVNSDREAIDQLRQIRDVEDLSPRAEGEMDAVINYLERR